MGPRRAAMIAFLGIGTLLLTGCTPAPGPAPRTPGSSPTAKPSPTKTPSIVQDVLTTAGKTLIQSKKGREWMMEVLKVVWNEDLQRAHVENVDWTLTDKKGRKVLRVQAPAATYSPEKNRIEFEGRVLATRYFNKDRIIVKHLVWEGKTSEFIGTQGVRWEKGAVLVTGDRMRSPDSLEKIHVEGHVHASGFIDQVPMP